MVIDGMGETPAEHLMKYLKESEDIRFVALTASKNRESLITIRMSKKDRSSCNEYTYLDNSIQDPQDNHNTFAQQAMKALTLQDGVTLLLGVAWITEEGM